MNNKTAISFWNAAAGKMRRCQQFIAREEVSRPLIGLMWEPMVRPLKDYVHRIDRAKPARSEDLCPEEMCLAADKIMAYAEDIPQDMFFAAQACFGHQWLEAILGCRIMVSEDTIWADQPEDASLETLANFEIDEDNPWFSAMVACHANLVEHSSGRYPVAVPILHGPLDLLAAFVGVEQLSYNLYDQPQLVLSALERVTELWCTAAKKLSGLLKPYQGGYVSRMHVWTPQPSATTQNDATYLVSPGNYEHFVLPFERQMSRTVTCPVYHCHNTSTHILPSMACILELTAIQMSVDPNGPPWENQRQAIAQLQENKPVVLSFCSISDADRAIKELSPRGLAITLNVKVKDGDPGDISLEEYIGWYQKSIESFTKTTR